MCKVISLISGELKEHFELTHSVTLMLRETGFTFIWQLCDSDADKLEAELHKAAISFRQL